LFREVYGFVQVVRGRGWNDGDDLAGSGIPALERGPGRMDEGLLTPSEIEGTP
jgi:hypothetical protein